MTLRLRAVALVAVVTALAFTLSSGSLAQHRRRSTPVQTPPVQTLRRRSLRRSRSCRGFAPVPTWFALDAYVSLNGAIGHRSQGRGLRSPRRRRAAENRKLRVHPAARSGPAGGASRAHHGCRIAADGDRERCAPLRPVPRHHARAPRGVVSREEPAHQPAGPGHRSGRHDRPDDARDVGAQPHAGAPHHDDRRHAAEQLVLGRAAAAQHVGPARAGSRDVLSGRSERRRAASRRS